MTAKHPPYFAFYPTDFASDSKVEAMCTEAVGGYILLLCKAWFEHPPGSLPDDDVLLARWARVNADTWVQIRAQIVAAFTKRDGRWFQRRMTDEFRKAKRRMKQYSDAGKAGMASRYRKDNDVTTSLVHGNSTRPDQTRLDAGKKNQLSPRVDLAGWLEGIGVGNPSRRRIVAAGCDPAVAESEWADCQSAKSPVGAFVERMNERYGIGKKSALRQTVNDVVAKIHGDQAEFQAAQNRLKQARQL